MSGEETRASLARAARASLRRAGAITRSLALPRVGGANEVIGRACLSDSFVSAQLRLSG